MVKKSLFLLVLLFPLAGCFFYEEYYEYETTTVTTPELSNQQKSEKSVMDYMTMRFLSSPYKYKTLGFGEWSVAEGEAREIAVLKSERKQLTLNVKNYSPKVFDSLLAVNDSLITLMSDSGAFYQIHHIFALKVNDFKYKCYEGVFKLNRSFKVTDVVLEMDLVLDEYQYASFNHYLKQDPLFCYETTYSNDQRSQALYNFYNNRLESGKVEKNEFMLTIIEVISEVRYSCKFEEPKIIKAMAKSYIKRFPWDYPNYQPFQFSEPQELTVKTVKAADSLIGYSIFHSFNIVDTIGGTLLTHCLYLELDPYFMVAGALTVDPPFEKYFEKK